MQKFITGVIGYVMASSSLKKDAILGVFWSAVQKFGISIISFTSNVVLARLLSPDDYGCIGLLAIFIAISNVFVNGGFVSALIQKKDTSAVDYSTVFYWNIVISLLFYWLLFVSAPFIASFYRIEQLSVILRVLGIVLVINGISVVQATILRKSFLFRKLAKINIISSIVSVSIAIFLAYSGSGVWALVAQQIIQRACSALILWFSSQWKPQLLFSIKSFVGMFSYGSFLLLSELVNSTFDNVQGLLIGKRYSAGDMGYYTQAKKLEEIPTQSISMLVAQVTFPIFSKIQDDKEKLFLAVKSTLSLMNYVNFSLMILLIIVAKPLLLLLYSEKWTSSVPYFQILCLAGLVNCMQSVNYQVVAAVGRSKELFYWNIIKRCFGIILMLVGMLYGVKGILWGMVISFYFTYIVNAWLASKYTHYTLFQQLVDSLPLFSIAVLAGIISYLCSCIINIHGYFLLLSSQVLFYVLIILLLSYAMRVKELFELIDILNIIIHRKK